MEQNSSIKNEQITATLNNTGESKRHNIGQQKLDTKGNLLPLT